MCGMHRSGSISPLLSFVLVLTIALTGVRAISDSARRVETTFLFILASQPDNPQVPSECPSTIRHTTIERYQGIKATDPSAILDGIVWQDLVANGVTCLDSPAREASTYFEDRTPSPPDTPADTANPWFLVGVDNSARRCGPFAPKYPARYLFTDDMPRFKQRFIDTGVIPSNIELPDSIANPVRGDIFMISQQFSPQPEDTVYSRIACIFQAATPAPTPESTPASMTDDGGSVCFPAHATVWDEQGNRIPMDQLRLGDRIQVTSAGMISPVISFSHRHDNILARTIVLSISGRSSQPYPNITTFSASSSHLLRLPDGSLCPVGLMRRGDSIILAGGNIGRVERVSSQLAKGLYSPMTAHGDIVVDGVVASCYTTSLRAQIAHTLLVPVRALFSAALAIGLPKAEWCNIIDVLRRIFR